MSTEVQTTKKDNKFVAGLKDYFNITDYKNDPTRLSPKNLVMFSLGTLGRDFLYNLFSAYLMSYIMFTKHLTEAQFGVVTAIVIAARIFDALNDPLMGGIVENTRSKWGKFKPWQLLGAILTGGVILAMFCNDLQGDAFLILLAFMYFALSITFTMNDISYWGMMPSLSSNEVDRSKLTSFAQLVASAGGGLAGLLIPVFTTGQFKAVPGYIAMSVTAVVLMIGFQMFTIFGVTEKPLSPNEAKAPKMTLKDMFKVIFKNDQLLWATLIMLIFCTGTSIVNAGLGMNYLYFEFGYEGGYTVLFYAAFSVTSTVFTLIYPILSKKYTRNKLITMTGCSMIVGYVLMLIFGLSIPHAAQFTPMWYGKFAMMVLANGFVGFGQGMYMILVLSIANTVEYNELKTGERKEGIIFSLRPFTAKLSNALALGIVNIVFLASGALTFTNKIADIEQEAAGLENFDKIAAVNPIINSVPEQTKIIILCCMCIIPIVTMIICMALYHKKYILTDEKYAEICSILKERHKKEGQEENAIEGSTNESETLDDEAKEDDKSEDKVEDAEQIVEEDTVEHPTPTAEETKDPPDVKDEGK